MSNFKVKHVLMGVAFLKEHFSEASLHYSTLISY